MKRFSLPAKHMTLRAKMNLFALLNILVVLALVISILSFMFIQIQFRETGQQALMLSRTVADIPQIVQAFQEKDPSSIIQPLTEKIRNRTGAEFIVVGNMDLIRYSHPNPSLIGTKMTGEDDKIKLTKNEVISEAMGSLGLTERANSPILDANQRQIGFVSAGFLVQNIWDKLFVYLMEIVGLGVIGLAIGLAGAHLLSGHIKRQIFNMEPHEIAFLTQEQAAIMESIREGIIAVNRDGIITACNLEAKRILESDSSDLIGKPISTVLPNSQLPDVLLDGSNHNDQPMIIGNTLVIANRIPVFLNGNVIGAVSSFRDKMQLDQINQRMADIERYTDALRSQRHEFMNRLHTISGLIQMEEYDLVRQLINQVNNEQQHVMEFFMTRIRDAAIVGMLIGKMHRAKELGIQLTVDPKTHVPEICPNRETVLTILGNAIENAFEALSGYHNKAQVPSIIISIHDETDSLKIQVKDNGPGIDPSLKERIFEDGVTTKGSGRGFGLALLTRLVLNINGKLAIVSSSEGATLEAYLPKS